jgi:peptidoglycan/LPS O-acetylase OafA/YrhL
VIRSIYAVFGGAVVIVVVVIAGTIIAAALLAGPEGSVTASYLTANLAVSFAAAVLGGSVVVRLAPRRPLLHASVLAAILAAMTLPSVGTPASGQPPWYPLALLLIGVAGLACGALGGRRNALQVN